MICRKASPDSLIIRPTIVYSYLPTSKNFAMQLLDSFEKGTPIRVVTDQISTPTYAPNLASMIWELVKRNASGTFNVVGPDLLSREGFARIMAEVFGFDKALIRPVKTYELGQKAKRPLSGGLKTDKLVHFLGIRSAGVRRAMGDMRQLASIDESG